MIVSVMMYLLAVSAVIGAAAWLADEGLRRVGVPTRWLWLGALAAPPALLLVAWLLPRMERSFASAQRIVARLDALALAEGRPVSRALAARVLADAA